MKSILRGSRRRGAAGATLLLLLLPPLLLLAAACGGDADVEDGGLTAQEQVWEDRRQERIARATLEASQPTVDPLSFLDGVFQNSDDGMPQRATLPPVGELATIAPTATPAPPTAEASPAEVAERQSRECTARWREELLRLPAEAGYEVFVGAEAAFRRDNGDCDGQTWRFAMRPGVAPACADVVFGHGLGRLPAPATTGWHSEGRALWVHFDQSPMGTGGGCWLYAQAAGWLERSGDEGGLGRLLTVYDVDASVPGYAEFRDTALVNCDHRLRGYLAGLEGPRDGASLLRAIDDFSRDGVNLDCAGAGWTAAPQAESDTCYGAPGGELGTGKYEDGMVVVHWTEASVLGAGGSCWTYDAVESAWFRSVDRGPVEPGGSAALTPTLEDSMLGETEAGEAFESDSPVAGMLPLLGDDAPLLADPGRTEVCDLIMRSVLLLNPGPRGPPDYAFLINAIQHGVVGGVCVADRWAPGVQGRLDRQSAAGVTLPVSLRQGTGFDPETGSIRVVFYEDERPYDGAREWIWLAGGAGWQSLR